MIVAAKRTPQGRFLGGLAKRKAADLAKAAAKAALAGLAPEKIDQVILGNVLAAGQGMNVARQVGVGVGVPVEKPAYAVNMMCASGMHAVILAAQTVRLGDAGAILCGGTESMSNAPYLLDRARGGYKLGDGVLVDVVLRDGLVDTFSGLHMGLTAERLAEKYAIPRSAQDAFAVRSQKNYGAAAAAGRFRDELVPVDDLAADEHPRPETTVEKLSTLAPAFKPDGTVTPGNASGINDGAAVVVLADEAVAAKHGWRPLAVLSAWAYVGCDPQWMGLGPVWAIRELCRRTGTSPRDFDTIEINEAFAVQTLACLKELGLPDENRVNPDGGAIALGHPIGASGARLIVHLAHRIARGETRRGLAALCVGGGMGSAVMMESP